MNLNKFPLRYSIPIGILLFNLLVLVFDFRTDVRSYNSQAIENASVDLREKGLLLTTEVESAIRNENFSEARDFINHISGFKDINHVFVIDSGQNILISDDFRLEGKDIMQFTGEDSLVFSGYGNMDYDTRIFYDDKEKLLYNSNEIYIGTSEGSLLPDKTGLVVVIKNMSDRLLAIRQDIFTDAWQSAVIYLLFSFMLWALFQFLFLRRISAIITGFNNPEQLNSKLFDGRDEISKLAGGILKTHNQLRKTLTRYQTILNTSNVAIAEVNPKGEYMYVNGAWEDLFGYSSEEALGKKTDMIVHPDEKDFSMFEKVKQGELTHYSQTRQYKNKMGEKIWCELYVGANLKNEKVESLVGVMLDITELKSAQKSLQEQNTYIQTILNNIPLGIAVNKFDEGDAVYLNRKFEQIYGWPRDVLKSFSNFFEMVYPDENYREKIKQQVVNDVETGDPEKMHWEEIEITTQSGEKRIINAQNIPLFEQNLMISTVQDVTEKIKSQRERDLIFENSADLVCTASQDGYLQQLNPAWKIVLGWSEEELKAKPFTSFIHPDDLKKTTDATKNLQNGEPALGFENRYLAKDGSYKWLSWNTIPLLQDKIILGIARDITESKLMESNLLRNQNLLNQTGKMAQVGGWEVNLETMQTFFTEETYRIYELPPGKPPKVEEGIRFYAPEAQPIIQNVFNGAIEMQKPYDIEVPFITAKGNHIWIRTMGEVEVKDGKAVRMYGAIQDITLQKKAAEELLETKELLEKTINSLSEAVLVLDAESRSIKLVNEAFKSIFGYKDAEVLGRNTEFLHLNQEMFEKFAKLGDPELDKHGVFQTEFQMRCKDGSVVDTDNRVSAIMDEEGWNAGVVSVIRDVTERKNAERKLKEYQAALKQLTTELSLAEEKQRKEIAANIHDHLSQSLVISKMKLNDLQDEEGLYKYKNELNVIKSHISEALEKSRKITYDLSPPVLYEMGLIDTMYWLTDKVQEESKMNIDFESDFEAIIFSEAKLILLYRSVQELIYNIIKHAEAKNVNIRFKKIDEGVNMIIKDDGKGFNPSGVEAKKLKSNSFGLFAVKERIQNMGGQFYIDSTPGKGTEAKIYLPLESTKWV